MVPEARQALITAKLRLPAETRRIAYAKLPKLVSQIHSEMPKCRNCRNCRNCLAFWHRMLYDIHIVSTYDNFFLINFFLKKKYTNLFLFRDGSCIRISDWKLER